MAHTDQPAAADLRRWRDNRQGEVDGAAMYRLLSELEPQEQLAGVYRRLAETEERHAALWEERLRAHGQAPGPARPSRRTRILMGLARRFGPQFVLPTLQAREEADSGHYDDQPDAAAAALPADERSHARLLRQLSGGAGVEGPALARFEGRHRATSGNALRAAVLGANDGLLSNFSLVMGVAGAQLAGSAVLVTGLAGLLAGAGSMAMGEWISVQSARELYTRQIDVERAELEEVPEEEEAELALIYEAKGLAPEAAAELAARQIADRSSALDTLAREELGIDPDELGGSAVEAAGTSFVLFAVGAAIPVVPFLFLGGTAAALISAALSAAALFGIGAAITLMTGRSVLASGTRQVAIGGAAAALTYVVGRLIGGAVGV